MKTEKAQLHELADRLQKQNEVLMLQPPPKPRRTFTDTLNYFRTPNQTKGESLK